MLVAVRRRGIRMRKWSILAMAVALMGQTVVMAAEEPSQGIQWAASFQDAMTRAKAENKPVFVEFFNPK
jgi:hypothetical protein